MLSTHAETPGAGASTLSLHEGVLLSAGHAFTDDLQISGGGLVPVWPGSPWAGFAQGKVVVGRTPATTVALRTTGSLLRQRTGNGVAATLGGGLLVDAYPAARWLSVHGGLSVNAVRGSLVSRVIPFDGDATVALLELGATIRLSPRAAVLAETWLPVTVDDLRIDAFPVTLVPWVFRWGGPALAVDVGMLSGSGSLLGEGPLAIGWPYLAVTGRRTPALDPTP